MKGCYEQFKASVLREGSKGNKRITMPVAAANRMRNAGMLFPGWVRLSIPGFQSIFVEARFPPSRPSVAITLPEWAFSRLNFGDEIDMTVEDARPYRAVEADSDEWFHYVTDRYFPRYQGDTLVLHSRHEPPFKLRRYIEKAAWRVLGFFQAEGTKGATVIDWNVANANPALLEFISDRMVDMGISKERQYLEVLQGPEETAAEANAVFECVGIKISTTRPRVEVRGGHAAILHGHSSRPLLLLMKKLLECVFREGFEFPSRAAAREYALGWLDGDGTITITGVNRSVLELRLAGYEPEQQVVFKALHYGFDWRIQGGKFGGHRRHTSRVINIRECAELAVGGGFCFSLSRARMLYELERRVRNPRRITQEDANVAKALLEKLRPEIEKLRRLVPPERLPKGIKGVPYPLTSAYASFKFTLKKEA